MKFICVLIAIAFIAVVNASGPKIQNLCDRIKCDEADNVQVCGQNGQGQYKVFENSCEMKKYNCNRNQRFAPVDTDVCRIVYELGGGFFFQP